MANDGLDNDGAIDATKRRAACDECRTKKLKCKGEQPACARCARMGITCVYSPQKQMGRPRKRRRDGEPEASVYESLDSSSQVPHGASNATSSHHGSDHLSPNFESTGDGHVNFEGAFTPGGSLQPWLQSQPGQWDTPDVGTLPSLTPDSSSQSSPPSAHAHNHHGPGGGLLTHAAPEMGIHVPMDPSLVGGMGAGFQNASALPPCACLSTMYLALTNLQSIDMATAFPFGLHALKSAMSTASDVLACELCPQKFLSAIQNTHLMGTLLMSIAERYGKVLEAITAEAVRAEAAHEQKSFRLADLNTSTSHLHTGGLGCAATFNLSLSPAEWRKMAKKVVRAEVHGPEEGNECCVYFLGLAQTMTERQEKWHTMKLPEDFPRDSEGNPIGGPRIPKADHMCLKYSVFARKLVDEFDWS